MSGDKFCSHCGNELSQKMEQEIVHSKPIPPSSSKIKNNKKLFIILGVLLAIVIIIIGVVMIVNKTNEFEDPFEDIEDLTTIDTSSTIKEHQTVNSFTKKIDEDYKNGNLSSDDYIMQFAYSIYDTSKIDEKYQSTTLDVHEPRELFEKMGSMIHELSDETIVYIFEKYTLSDVEWNVSEVKH